jgi:ABC-2 type transport system permease protein
METTLDLSRCRAQPRGVVYRRWVISSTGLRQLFRGKFFMILLIVAWTASLGMAALGFAFSQTVVTGGWLEQGAASLGVRAQAIASAVGALVLLYPDVCVNGLFTLMFWAHSFVGLGLCLVALTVLVPRLIARDRAGNALIIYLARPLTSVDYLLGKLGIIAGLLVLLWTGPLVVGWLLSMAFAPNSDFFVYSISPLLRALLFNGISLVVLAAVALGISSVTRSSRATIVLWVSVWFFAGAIGSGRHAPVWLRQSSVMTNLSEVRKSMLRMDTAFIDAASKLPLLDPQIVQNLKRRGENSTAKDLPGALRALGLFVVLSSVVFLRKLRPE